MPSPAPLNSGMTLVETLVALTASALTTIAIFSIFQVHHRLALRQEASTLMQQELLAATSQMAEEIRMCGYSPTGKPGFGFTHMPETGKPNYGRATNETSIYCTLDSQGDGKIDESGSGSIRDHVGFRLNVFNSGVSKKAPDNVLRKYDTGAVHWQPFATNIGAVRFSYFDANGQTIINPGLNPELIRVVRLTVTAVPPKKWEQLGVKNRSMTTQVVCRNMAVKHK